MKGKDEPIEVEKDVEFISKVKSIDKQIVEGEDMKRRGKGSYGKDYLIKTLPHLPRTLGYPV